MMNADNVGTQMLDEMIERAIKKLENPRTEITCPGHEDLRTSAHIELLCRREDRRQRRQQHSASKEIDNGTWIEISKGKIKAHGFAALILSLIIGFVIQQYYHGKRIERFAERAAVRLQDVDAQTVRNDRRDAVK